MWLRHPSVRDLLCCLGHFVQLIRAPPELICELLDLTAKAVDHAQHLVLLGSQPLLPVQRPLQAAALCAELCTQGGQLRPQLPLASSRHSPRGRRRRGTALLPLLGFRWLRVLQPASREDRLALLPSRPRPCVLLQRCWPHPTVQLRHCRLHGCPRAWRSCLLRCRWLATLTRVSP